MENLWKSSNPKHGWVLIDVIDAGEYGAEQCGWCGTLIRYQHEIAHPEINEKHYVGCICCEKLTGDYETPRKKEKELKSRSAKFKTWVYSPRWKLTENGNYYRKDCDVLIYSTGNGWKLKIGGIWGKKTFKTLLEAKRAVFKYLFESSLRAPKRAE